MKGTIDKMVSASTKANSIKIKTTRKYKRSLKERNERSKKQSEERNSHVIRIIY